ncbi:MAG: TIM barrel protein [Firmicutes bacterium]|nr:TIM barrel protein [Bacillota bacterium]
MYLAMDDFGDDNLENLISLGDAQEKWQFLARLAQEFGCPGIQITPWLYEQKLGLDLDAIPAAFTDFRLTYHIGGVRPLVDARDCRRLDKRLALGLDRAVKSGFEDVSFHPPRLTEVGRKHSKEQLAGLVERWLPRFAARGVTFSLETHVSGDIFIFDGLADFRRFVQRFPELGVLIDVSHNVYDGYGVDEIISFSAGLRITGLHLSDARSDLPFDQGTHLPVGSGEIAFAPLVAEFSSSDICAALEVKGDSDNLTASFEKLQNLQDNLYI